MEENKVLQDKFEEPNAFLNACNDDENIEVIELEEPNDEGDEENGI